MLTDSSTYSSVKEQFSAIRYVCVLMSGIRFLTRSVQTPPILLYDPRFTTTGPTYLADPMVRRFLNVLVFELTFNQAWSVFLQSQQAITTCTQFVIDLDATLKRGTNSTAIWDRMLELESIIEPLINNADTWTLSTNPQPALDQSELVVGQALRGMARIKLNRSADPLFPTEPKC